MSTHKVLRLSGSDLDALARIVEAEAGNQSDQGKLAVAFTVLNRVAAPTGGFPNSVPQVIEQRGQFEPMNSRRSWTDLPSAKDSTKSLLMSGLSAYAAGNLTDPTSGATFFQNPSITNQRGTNFAATPATYIEGDHHFYNRYKLNPVVEVPAYSLSFDGTHPSSGDFLPNSQTASPSRTQMEAPANRSLPATNGSAFGDAYRSAFSRGLSANDAPKNQSSFAAAYDSSLNSASIGPENTSSPEATSSFRPRTKSDGTLSGLSAVHDGVSFDGIHPAALEAASFAAATLGFDLPITSGSRSQARQDAIRNSGDPNRPTVAKHSHHTSTNGGSPTALDISTADMSPTDRARMVDALAAAGFTGFGFYDTHIHVDMREAVPSSFNLDKGWGGWTKIPDYASTILRQRGFSAGRPANKIRRGFGQ